MRILMLGWEFPPFISGGLGTACRGLTDAMGRLQARILFVLPRAVESEAQAGSGNEEVESQDGPRRAFQTSSGLMQAAGDLELAPVPCEITNPYQTASPQPMNTWAQNSAHADPLKEASLERPKPSSVRIMGAGGEDGYDGDLQGKIHAYADRCVGLTRGELFDVIHAHDWMTFPAAVAIAGFSGRPLVVHVHATEFDRSGEHINRPVYDIERFGMHAATTVIAVSDRTRRTIIERYGVPPEKVNVVYNGIESNGLVERPPRAQRREKVVLFLGRITRQKGPEFFVRAAARVAERVDHVKFVMAGAGDLLPSIVKLVDELGLKDIVEFTGFLHGSDVERAYQEADVYAMPSISEPFGLTALEAVRHGVPVVLSKNSGVAEVLQRGALKVDFWDVEMMAKMIVSILRYPALADMLRRESAAEIRGLTWDEAARKCIRFYYDAIRHGANNSRPFSVAVS